MTTTGRFVTFLALIAVLGGAAFYYFKAPPAAAPAAPATVKSEGSVTFSVTDAAVNMGAVSEVTLAVNKVELHSAANGWVTVASDEKNFDLLTLKAKGESKLLAHATVTVDSYDQVRLGVAKVSVKTKAGKTEVAAVPATITFATRVDVAANAEASAHVDVLADKSLHTSASGGYIFLPVMDVETRVGATVTATADEAVTIDGGNVLSHATIGTDIAGNAQAGFSVGSSLKLDVKGGVITAPSGSAGAGALIQVETGGQATSTSAASTSANATVDVKVGVPGVKVDTR